MEGHDFEPPSPAESGDFQDPYSDVDESSLPGWWQEAIDEFRKHRLPPYRPPRFEDGTLKHEVVEPLENELGIQIDFIGINTEPGDEWSIRVDGDPVATIGHARASARYSVFGMSADEFESLIRSAVA